MCYTVDRKINPHCLLMKLASITLLLVFFSPYLYIRVSWGVSIHTYLCALLPYGNPVRIESLYRLQRWSSARNIKRASTTKGILMDRNFHAENRKTETMEKNPRIMWYVYPKHLAKPITCFRFLSCYIKRNQRTTCYTIDNELYVCVILATVLCTLSNLFKRMCSYVTVLLLKYITKKQKKKAVYITS